MSSSAQSNDAVEKVYSYEDCVVSQSEYQESLGADLEKGYYILEKPMSLPYASRRVIPSHKETFMGNFSLANEQLLRSLAAKVEALNQQMIGITTVTQIIIAPLVAAHSDKDRAQLISRLNQIQQQAEASDQMTAKSAAIFATHVLAQIDKEVHALNQQG
jgi:hypothetical protein